MRKETGRRIRIRAGRGRLTATFVREEGAQVMRRIHHVGIVVKRLTDAYAFYRDVLGLPLGTLKSRLFRARLALRDELKPYMQ